MAGSGVPKYRYEVAEIIESRIGHLWAEWEEDSPNNPIFQLWDGKYYLPSVGEARNMVREACKKMPKYRDERFDCDDFAFLARGMAGEYAADKKWGAAGLCMGIVTAHCSWVGEFHVTCWLLYRDRSEETGKQASLLAWVDPQECNQLIKAGSNPRFRPPDDVQDIRAIIG